MPDSVSHGDWPRSHRWLFPLAMGRVYSRTWRRNSIPVILGASSYVAILLGGLIWAVIGGLLILFAKSRQR